MKRLLVIAMALLLTTDCTTTFVRPFADPVDAALTQKIWEALADYPHITATAVSGRVYLDGMILNHHERLAIFSIVEKVPGVTNIADGMRALAEMGNGRD